MQFRQKIFIFAMWRVGFPISDSCECRGRGHFSVSIICEYIASYVKAVIISTLRNVNFRLKKFLKSKEFLVSCPQPLDVKVSLKLSEKKVATFYLSRVHMSEYYEHDSQLLHKICENTGFH